MEIRMNLLKKSYWVGLALFAIGGWNLLDPSFSGASMIYPIYPAITAIDMSNSAVTTPPSKQQSSSQNFTSPFPPFGIPLTNTITVGTVSSDVHGTALTQYGSDPVFGYGAQALDLKQSGSASCVFCSSSDSIQLTSSIIANFSGTGKPFDLPGYWTTQPGQLSKGQPWDSSLSVIVTDTTTNTPIAQYFNSASALCLTSPSACAPGTPGQAETTFFYLVGSTVAGNNYSLSLTEYMSTSDFPGGGTGSDMNYAGLEVTPEPSTLALFGTGVLLLGMLASRKKKPVV